MSLMQTHGVHVHVKVMIVSFFSNCLVSRTNWLLTPLKIWLVASDRGKLINKFLKYIFYVREHH